MSRRRFSRLERSAAYLFSGGKCAICGVTLNPGFHVDHIIPFSRGGETDIINGQATCPECNLKKGARTMATSGLREWQTQGIEDYNMRELRDYLAVACPGAGKTRFACEIAKSLISSGEVARVIIVAPTSALREQWAGDMKKSVGLDIDFRWSPGPLSSAYHGAAVTYAGCCGINMELLRKASTEKRTLVIFDEIHHASGSEYDDSGGNTWGKAIRRAFECASRRLALSGTPFRTDGDALPFVNYHVGGERDGYVIANTNYPYAQALEDGIVREIRFHSCSGHVDVMDHETGAITRYNFNEELEEDQRTSLLRRAVTPPKHASMEWWGDESLYMCHEKLKTYKSSGHPRAGGLVIANLRDDADRIAERLKRITGSQPWVIHGDIDGANEKIKRFSESDDDWIVSVQMVSEGIDIPRLRVCSYMTSKSTELFFRQALGRIIRRCQGDDFDAYMVIPHDKRLLEYAARIEKEVKAVMAKEKLQPPPPEVPGPPDPPRPPSFFSVVGGEGKFEKSIHRGEEFTSEEIRVAEEAIATAGIGGITPEHAAKLFRAREQRGSLSAVSEVASAPPPPVRLLRDEMDDLRRQSQELVTLIAKSHYPSMDIGKACGKINGYANWKVGVSSIDADGPDGDRITKQLLSRRIEVLREILRSGRLPQIPGRPRFSRRDRGW